jgi:SIT family siderophore-iron:H+ symporter-like MFS transporter
MRDQTIEGIMQAVSQPPFAKLCDIIGRWESYGVSVFLYTLGYIIVATSQNVGTYAGGTSELVLVASLPR